MNKSYRSTPSPYGRQVAASIAALLRLFQDKVPDTESNLEVLALTNSQQWSSACRTRSRVRDRYLAVSSDTEDKIRAAQYAFEEACLETLYNDTDPDDPFDSISPYWVVPRAIQLATALSIPIDDVIQVMYPTHW